MKRHCEALGDSLSKSISGGAPWQSIFSSVYMQMDYRGASMTEYVDSMEKAPRNDAPSRAGTYPIVGYQLSHPQPRLSQNLHTSSYLILLELGYGTIFGRGFSSGAGAWCARRTSFCESG